jgi:hypothetical protein
VRVPFGTRQFWVRLNGQPWPKDARPVSLKLEATAYDDEDVDAGVYTYQVIGHNSGGDGPPSASVNVTVT